MQFLERLLDDTEYLTILKRLEEIEQGRRFCRHGLTHLLDTARIAWISWLEWTGSGQGQEWTVSDSDVFLEKEDIYLAALLHDLGRIREYEEGIPHQEAGVDLAEGLLRKIGYPLDRSNMIIGAIRGHRSGAKLQATVDENLTAAIEHSEEKAQTLASLLHWADKRSRNCFYCEAQVDCKWPKEKQNQTIIY